MTSAAYIPVKAFEPGTTGWTVDDLGIAAIERAWFTGRYEIVDGVLTKTPPAYFAGGESLFKLICLLRDHVVKQGPEGSFAGEVDIIVGADRVAVADAVFLTAADRRRQQNAGDRAKKDDPARTRILVPPTLVIKSVSPGHEAHDDRTKRRWYAEFGISNYWILDAYRHELTCLLLAGGKYKVDQQGRDADTLHPSMFAGLSIGLRDLWGD